MNGVGISAPNGQQPSVVATALADHTAMVWGLRGGEPMAVLKWHTKGLSYICIGAFDGSSLAVTASYDQTVHKLNLATGKQRDVLQRHTDIVVVVQLSASGTRHACGCDILLRLCRLRDVAKNPSLEHILIWVLL